MADATTPTTPNETIAPRGLALQIANAVALYKGRFAGIRGPTHGTSQGYVDHYDDEPGMVFAGMLESAGGLAQKTGDTSASPVPEAALQILPSIQRRVTVTGAASRGDILKPVYAEDNQTLTLTRPSDDAEVVGVVIEWHTSTTCDVLLFGLVCQLILGMAGGNRTLIHLGHFDANTVANGDLRTAIPMPFHGKFVDVFAMIDVAIAGAGATASINLEIGGTNVTGGVVTIAENDAKGTKKSGTAITAENVFHEGDTVDVEAASVTDATAGSFDLYAVVERLPGC